jgi:hypothetical protein
MADSPLPEARIWEFRNPETGESRKYAQRELTIDGEVQLIGLIGRTTERLSERNFPWDGVRDVLRDFEAKGIESADWAAISRLMSLAMAELPEVAAEAVAILLNMFPTTANGERNPKFDEEVVFIRSALKFERLVDMVQVFATQNDYKRLAAPFVQALRRIWDEVASSTTPTSLPVSASTKA